MIFNKIKHHLPNRQKVQAHKQEVVHYFSTHPIKATGAALSASIVFFVGIGSAIMLFQSREERVPAAPVAAAQSSHDQDESEPNDLQDIDDNPKASPQDSPGYDQSKPSPDQSTSPSQEKIPDSFPHDSSANTYSEDQDSTASMTTDQTDSFPSTVPTIQTTQSAPTSTPQPTHSPTLTPTPTSVISDIKIRAYYHLIDSDITVDNAPVTLTDLTTGESMEGFTDQDGYSPTWQLPANHDFEVYLYPPRDWSGTYCGDKWTANTGPYGTSQNQHLRIFPDGQEPCYQE